MNQTYSHINKLICNHQIQIEYFNESLIQKQSSTQLNATHFDHLFAVIETNASKMNENEVKQLKTKVITLRIDFSHKLLSTAQTLFELANIGSVDAEACLKARRLVAMAEYSLLSSKITPKFKEELQQLIAQLNTFIQKYEVKFTTTGSPNQPTIISTQTNHNFTKPTHSHYNPPKPAPQENKTIKLLKQSSPSPITELSVEEQNQVLLLNVIQSLRDQYTPNLAAQAQQILQIAQERLLDITLSKDFRNDLNTSIEGLRAKMASPQSKTILTRKEKLNLCEEFRVQLESLESNLTIARWKSLLSRNILNLRIDIKVINELTQKAEQLNDGSPTGQTQSTDRLQQIEDLKLQFMKILFSLLNSQSQNPEPGHLQQLLTLGNLCVQSPYFSSPVTQRLNDVLTSFKSSSVLPDELLLNIVSFLGVKNLGIAAQVSKSFSKAANNEQIWKELCENSTEKDVIDFSLVPYPHKSYKELYKAETEFLHFMQSNFLFLRAYNRALQTNVSIQAPLDFANEKLKIKHLKQIMKKVAMNDTSFFSLIDKNTPYSHIQIMFAGKNITNDTAIKPLGWNKESSPQFIIHANDALASHLAKTMNEAASNPQVSEAMIKQFIERGGRIEILEEGKPVKLNRTNPFIVGCCSGVNRSQVARAFLLKNGCQVQAPLAGGDSGMNPAATHPLFCYIYFNEDGWDQKAFKEACGCDKIPQLGANELEDVRDFDTHEQWFKNYFNNLPAQPYQFLCFSSSGPSVILRLLDKEGDLTGYKVTFIPWIDQIAYPTEGIVSFSAEAYKAFFDRLSKNLILS